MKSAKDLFGVLFTANLLGGGRPPNLERDKTEESKAVESNCLECKKPNSSYGTIFCSAKCAKDNKERRREKNRRPEARRTRNA